MQRSPNAAQKFADEVDRSIDLVAAKPKQWPAGKFSTRKLTLRRFPFAVIYRITTERIEIVAFALGYRQPGYWEKRL
jgi:toxin ParE1/3/4